jgi:hypothetical protein
MAWQNMAVAVPKYHVPNSRNKDLVHNGVLILPNCEIVIGRFKLAQYFYGLEKQGWSQNFMYLTEETVFLGIMVPGFYLKYAFF